ncbi:acylphosphatase [Alkalihalobacillus sp. LMS39]|uniref:acylphosphatase n=1 Tax=Alkalihalobacillus sp. LMS39 TaxID=2924032 RepID=UPI001FB44B20|nr:acylphosphatase [Alkalihalobacillus sp. LMS39]UOE93823.1 acylphosphatase [Alkalihalobacillus sp. LMS39]
MEQMDSNSNIENNENWLPHLMSEIVADARGPELDAYVVALEGWRRGLTLRWHTKDSEKFPEIKTWFVDKPGKLFSLSSESRTHYFFRTRGDKVTNEAVELGMDKEKTKQLLMKENIRVPEGKEFSSETEVEVIQDYVNTIGYPVVVKPVNGSFGRGVTTNIRSTEMLKEAISNAKSQGYDELIVERHIEGNEYRLYVVNNEVYGALLRIPAHVIGNGTLSIRKLIEEKNEQRGNNPRLISCLIKIDDEMQAYLQANGYSLDSIPNEGEKINLTSKSNISIGGDPVDVLDEFSPEVKEVAIRALHAVPNLMHGAVDLIIEDGKSVEEAAVILELNPTAQIGSLLFPAKGKARDIPAAIIDYYFPETKGIITDKHKIYFDFQDIIDPLSTKVATVTTVSAAPVGKLFVKKYIVSGEVQGIDYHRGLRKQAFERNLSGFVRSIEDGEIEVIVLGKDEESVEHFREALLEDPERSDVQGIREEQYNAPIKVGFEVKADLKTQVEQLKLLQQQMDIIQKELKITRHQYRKYTRTLSWQLTWPLRKVTDAVKYIIRLVKG